MASRILVKCTSELIPGNPIHRDTEIANIVCKHEWGRDFDNHSDTLSSLGQYAVDQVRCYFLLDHGPTQSKDPKITVYRWDGNRLNQRPLSPSIIAYLKNIPFRPSRTSDMGLSDDEFLAAHGEEEFGKLLFQRIEQKKRWGYRLLPVELGFLEKHPELA
ncbi:hypothetical protein HIM_12415 [Hirsutella minnesotensis 3608]|uniref:Uncharacterized protein n=1 Tax=Hirsutella minnesotensis 3608 TaxID=1043627 RepID=A0A0F7ZW18_9HYPO|nr:hypothetical protein HIM_12415 [Hirsutella minnesotensis 3608]